MFGSRLVPPAKRLAAMLALGAAVALPLMPTPALAVYPDATAFFPFGQESLAAEPGETIDVTVFFADRLELDTRGSLRITVPLAITNVELRGASPGLTCDMFGPDAAIGGTVIRCATDLLPGVSDAKQVTVRAKAPTKAGAYTITAQAQAGTLGNDSNSEDNRAELTVKVFQVTTTRGEASPERSQPNQRKGSTKRESPF